jgi:hypothetical protein
MPDFKIASIRYTWKGTWTTLNAYLGDDVVYYGGKAYVCVLAHTSTTSFATDLAQGTLWVQMFDGYTWRGSWNISTQYNPGDTVSYGALVYRCITSHTSSATVISGLEANQSSWTLVSQSDSWKIASGPGATWSLSTQYKINDVVVYGGYVYRCTTSHTSAATVALGLEANQSAWQVVYQQLFYQSTWSVGYRYRQLDIVQFDGSLYVCATAHTSTAFLNDFNASRWTVYLPALEYLTSPWSSLTQYYVNDVVNYGGYSYRATSANQGQIPDINTSYWSIVTENYYFQNNWAATDINGSKTYLIGSVVRVDGYVYVAILDNTNIQPPNATYWQLIVPGRFWLGNWATGNPYVLGDLVSYAGISYECVLAHTAASGNLPPTDVAAGTASIGTYWKTYSVGSTTNVLITQGDTLYFNSGAKSRLPIGTPGQTLRSTGGTTLSWANFGVINKVYYVAPNGADVGTAGTSLNSPWKSVAYACSTLINQGITGATIFIKTGTYNEVLPISVPAGCSLVGDELRTTIIQPDPTVPGNVLRNMFYVRNGVTIRNMTLQGLTGTLNGQPNVYFTQRVTAGAYVSLDPGTGSNDSSVWITTKSPYVQNVTTFGTGCIGLKVDGLLHNGGNRSIVANDFTQVLSDGIGVWINSLGRSECVSVFTYYNYIGYLCENGGKLRATNGNNSYGVYGSVAEGVYGPETPISALVYNRSTQATVGLAFTNGSRLINFEFNNAGNNYTNPSYTVTGTGLGVVIDNSNIRNAAIFEIRSTDPANTGFPGGNSYYTAIGLAQSGSNAGTITISASDTNTFTTIGGMRVVITSGLGAGQYGYIAGFNSTTKVATIYSEVTGAQGWDNMYAGTPATNLDNSSSYIIEPRVVVTSPGFSTAGGSLQQSAYWTNLVYGNGYFVAIDGQSQLVNYSINGINWNSGSGLIQMGASTSAVYANNVFMVANSNSSSIAYSSGGITWASSTLPGTTFGNSNITAVNSLIFGNSAAIISNTGNRTNSLIYSNTFTNAAWTNYLSFVSSAGTATPSPDGTNNAFKLVDNTSNSEHAIYYVRTNVSSETVTVSVFAKAAERSQVNLGFTNNTPASTPTQCFATFDLNAGTIVNSPSNAGDYSASSAGIYSVGNGWYRLYVTVTKAVTVNTNNYPFMDVVSGGLQTYVGTGISGIYIYGSQLETGTRATAYIPTAGATANGTYELFKSKDALTWTSYGSPAIGAGPMAYGAGIYVSFASTSSNQVQYSYNGIIWATATLPATQIWTKVAYGNGMFIAISQGSTTGAYSLNGSTWYSSTLPGANQWIDLQFGQGLFMAIASGSVFNAQTQDGINWFQNTVGTSPAWQCLAVSNPTFGNGAAKFVAVTSGSNISSVMVTGATAKARAVVTNGQIRTFRMINVGSGYVVGPTLTVTDPNLSVPVTYSVRYGDGVLATPTFISGGTGYLTAGVTLTDSTGYADVYQTGTSINVSNMSSTPTPGSNVVFTNTPTNSNVYKLVSFTNVTGTLGNQYATLTFDKSVTNYYSMATGTPAAIRILYSQIRLTGHDFLSINSGNYVNTNYPANSFYTPSLSTFQTVEGGGGHVFYTATDQDGNFTVGNIFGVAQATGTVTLSASLFNLSGLTQLSLGAIVVGSTSAIINTISTDGTMSANSDNTMSTQRAVKSYVASRLGQGGGTSQVNSATAGYIQIVNDASGTGSLATTTGNQINMAQKVLFNGPYAGVDGAMLATAYFMNSFSQQ